ncbi:hypothetical protein ACN4Z3_17090, partial [Legionella sp. 29fVS95]
LFILIITLLFTCVGQAKNTASFYQVDLIVFTHQSAYSLPADFTATSLETLRLMVQAGRGVTLLPALSVYKVAPGDLQIIPF